MITHMPGFQFFSAFLHHFVQEKFATSSVRVNRVELTGLLESVPIKGVIGVFIR